MEFKAIFKTIILTIFSLGVFSTQASELEIPNTFVDGEVTSASEMNANFEAIKAAVNDNHALINNGGNSSRVQFVGFTPTAVNVQAGMFAAKQMCTDFVSNSYICTYDDVNSMVVSSAVRTAVSNSEFETAFYISSYSLTKQCTSFTLTDDQIQNPTGNAGESSEVIDRLGSRLLPQSCSIPAALACCK